MLHAGKRQKRRDARSVAATGTKLQGNATDKHDGSQRAKTAGVKAKRSRRYENNEFFFCGKQGHKQWDCPQSQQGKAEKGVSWPEPRLGPHAAAAFHKRSRSVYPEQIHRDSLCVCHPYGWS